MSNAFTHIPTCGVCFTSQVIDQHPNLLRSIVYDFGTADESFEWYHVRDASPSEFQLLDGIVNIVDLVKPAAPTANWGASGHGGAAAAPMRGMAAPPAKPAGQMCLFSSLIGKHPALPSSGFE